eukprot:8774996-Lingulodinium_polyedra.AAC.1
MPSPLQGTAGVVGGAGFSPPRFPVPRSQRRSSPRTGDISEQEKATPRAAPETYEPFDKPRWSKAMSGCPAGSRP